MSRFLNAYEGSSFVVLDPSGDILDGCESGLYCEDTRFLSRHELLVGGARPLVLSSRAPSAHVIKVFATNPAIPGVPRGALVIERSFAVGSGLHADLDVTSHATEPIALDLELAYDADFADVFEVKRFIEAPERVAVEHASAQALGRQVLALAHDSAAGWSRRTEVRFSERPILEVRRARFRVTLSPGGSFHLCQDVFAIADGEFRPPRYRCGGELLEEAPPAVVIPSGAGELPVLASDDPVLDQAFARSLRDLEALRIHPSEGAQGDFHLAAGVPWFMALFGRDSLIAAYQAMAFAPDLARGVLRSLARMQGKKRDPDTEEQPGKILHEYRPPGLRGSRSFVPRFPYYGSVDATPLFVIVLSEHLHRTGDLAFARAMERHLAAALGWIEGGGDPDGDGFVEYARSTEHGLRNQGWKDSEDAVRFRDGRLAEGPIALVEVQGYAYDALVRAAGIYRALGGYEARAAKLLARAEALRPAIDRAFWMEDRGYWAMALDGEKRRADALTSNPAHLLWSGAALPERATHAAARLLSPELFSGFGVRTLGRGEAGFSPIAYHNGSVWPHDTSIAAAGLARYGLREEAALLCGALLDAVEQYDERRLPELFGGFARDRVAFPVEYPTSNSPQAWAAGAVLLVVTTMLGLRISALDRSIEVHPALPPRVSQLSLRGLRVGGAEVAIEARRDGDRAVVEVRGAPAEYVVSTD